MNYIYIYILEYTIHTDKFFRLYFVYEQSVYIMILLPLLKKKTDTFMHTYRKIYIFNIIVFF